MVTPTLPDRTRPAGEPTWWNGVAAMQAVPTWAWIAGGVAVAGTVAFLVLRPKRRRS